jgi:hypothetical protein
MWDARKTAHQIKAENAKFDKDVTRSLSRSGLYDPKNGSLIVASSKFNPDMSTVQLKRTGLDNNPARITPVRLTFAPNVVSPSPQIDRAILRNLDQFAKTGKKSSGLWEQYAQHTRKDSKLNLNPDFTSRLSHGCTK